MLSHPWKLPFGSQKQTTSSPSSKNSIFNPHGFSGAHAKQLVRVTKNLDGTYTAQVFWVEKPLDTNGNKRKDVKNPDKSLRNVDIDKVVLVKGLKYDADDKCWGGTKIYDPSKGNIIG